HRPNPLLALSMCDAFGTLPATTWESLRRIRHQDAVFDRIAQHSRERRADEPNAVLAQPFTLAGEQVADVAPVQRAEFHGLREVGTDVEAQILFVRLPRFRRDFPTAPLQPSLRVCCDGYFSLFSCCGRCVSRFLHLVGEERLGCLACGREQAASD